MFTSRRAGPLQHPRAGVGGGAARIDVVDQDDAPPLQLALAPLVDPEGAAHRLGALARAHAAQDRRRLDPVEQVEPRLEPRPPRQRGGDQRRLVVAAPPDPPAVQRHRREQRRARSVEMALHEPRDRFGDARPAAIFELERDAARDVAIGHRRAQPVIGRRLGQAAAAQHRRAFAIVERQRAARAAGFAEEGERRPAVEAEKVRRPE